MKVVTRYEIEGNELVIERAGVTTRMAAGPLTAQLIPALSMPDLTPEERAVLELLGLPFVALTVRERGDAK